MLFCVITVMWLIHIAVKIEEVNGLLILKNLHNKQYQALLETMWTFERESTKKVLKCGY